MAYAVSDVRPMPTYDIVRRAPADDFRLREAIALCDR